MDRKAAMPWYRVKMTSADIARNWHGILLSRFETFFITLKAPADMAMFSTTMTADVVMLYFSPATGQRAPAFLELANAEVCDRPTEPVNFLAGSPKMQKALQCGAV
jgi:hypothetical protein